MLMRATLLFVTFVCGAGFVARANRPETAPPRASFDRFPMELQAWRGQPLPAMDDKILKILGVDDYMNRVYYRDDRAAAGLYVGYYQSQRQGDAIHSPQNCLPGAGWEPTASSYLTVPVSADKGQSADISVNRYVIQKGLDRQLVLYWYQSHGRVVASEYWSKFYLVRDAVSMNRTDAALVRVIVPINASADNGELRAEQQAVDFVKAIYPILPMYVPS
jgi:EpsI family protein